MRSLRLKNFRSFNDTGRNELRPINILVGSNSSGKSSYLRFFPLLRQTVETSTRSPLLWYGGMLDFGDFSKTLRRGSSPATIGYEFEVDINQWRMRAPWRKKTSFNARLNIGVTLQHSEQTYVSKLEVSSSGDICVLEFSDAGVLSKFLSNGEDIIQYLGKELPSTVLSKFFPIVGPESFLEFSSKIAPLDQALASLLEPLAHNRTSDRTLLSYARRLSYGDDVSIFNSLKELNLRHLQEASIEEKLRKMKSLLFARDLGELLYAANQNLIRFASGINYLGPFRKDPERYYRQQELAVGQIEPHGENLAMFLKSLSSSEIADLSGFMQAHLGFGVSIQIEGNHVSVLVDEGKDRSFNLIDMGYGLSQVLPVIAQCWSTMNRGRRSPVRENVATVLAVEQPELHLHPSHQSRLADMFAAVVKNHQTLLKGDRKTRELPFFIVIETHSEALINRFGELIEQKNLDAEDVAVLLFSKEKSGDTIIKTSEYSEDGTLMNWPIGFFSP